MPALTQRRLFTVGDYYAMADAGVLTAEDRVELIDGEILPELEIAVADAPGLGHRNVELEG